MQYSNIAIELLAAKECGYIKTNASFINSYSNIDNFKQLIGSHQDIKQKVDELTTLLQSEKYDNCGMICYFDDDFPCININASNGDTPHLLFYKGNISLLSNLNNNVAVIGLIDPTENIINREKSLVKKIIDSNMVVVSGLANGCDTVAHQTCVDNNAPTIAILPCSITKVSPATNKNLAADILTHNGLLLSEYFGEPITKQNALARFIERDRLQSLFSKATIMIASYKKGEGDSGSRHAMKYSETYKTLRYVMYNKEHDQNNKQFFLNKDLLDSYKAQIITPQEILNIKNHINPNLIKNKKNKSEQLSLL